VPDDVPTRAEGNGGTTLDQADLVVGAPLQDLGPPGGPPPTDLSVVTGELAPEPDDDDDLVDRTPRSERRPATDDRLDTQDELLPAARNARARTPAPAGGNRVVAFLRASWAELHRVQWPNRRQVVQATAVVLGFVVIAGGYLGLADLVSSNLVDAIL